MSLWWIRGYGEFEIGGQKLRFVDVYERPHDWWARIAYNGAHEPEVAQFLSEQLQPGDTFFDIGAYMGQYSLMAARLGANAIAFEPDPSSQDLCLRNASLNGLEIDLVKSAVGEVEGTTRLARRHIGSSTSHPSVTSSRKDDFEVKVVTLDGFCERRAIWPDVVKVDIEGGEIFALGDAATKALEHVRALVVEVHEPAIIAAGHDPALLLSKLSRNRRRLNLENRATGNNYHVAFLRD